jgi:hypothetical protein
MRQTKSIDLRKHLTGEYRSYSGRGMYGEECQGFVYDSQHEAIMDMIVATSNAPDSDSLYDAFDGHRFDSMGMSVILYFPSVGV